MRPVWTICLPKYFSCILISSSSLSLFLSGRQADWLHASLYPKASLFERLKAGKLGNALKVVCSIHHSGDCTAHTAPLLYSNQSTNKCCNNYFSPDINTPVPLPTLCLDIKDLVLPNGKRCVLIGSFASTVLIRMNCCPSPVYDQ